MPDLGGGGGGAGERGGDTGAVQHIWVKVHGCLALEGVKPNACAQ